MKPKFAISLSIGCAATLSVLASSALAALKEQTVSQNCASHCPSTSNLVAQSPNQWALEDTLNALFRDEEGDIIYHFTEFDLNNDGVKEAIVIYTKTLECSNRSCPIQILEPAEGGSYDLMGELWGQRGQAQVVMLGSKTNGWLDLAIPLFSYEPRGLYWTVAKFNGSRYELTDTKLESVPDQSRVILDLENSPGFSLRN